MLPCGLGFTRQYKTQVGRMTEDDRSSLQGVESPQGAPGACGHPFHAGLEGEPIAYVKAERAHRVRQGTLAFVEEQDPVCRRDLPEYDRFHLTPEACNSTEVGHRGLQRDALAIIFA
jgi:hypothetical protein